MSVRYSELINTTIKIRQTLQLGKRLKKQFIYIMDLFSLDRRGELNFSIALMRGQDMNINAVIFFNVKCKNNWIGRITAILWVPITQH